MRHPSERSARDLLVSIYMLCSASSLESAQSEASWFASFSLWSMLAIRLWYNLFKAFWEFQRIFLLVHNAYRDCHWDALCLGRDAAGAWGDVECTELQNRQNPGLLHPWLENPSNGVLPTSPRWLDLLYPLQFPIQKVCWGFGGLFQSRFVGWLGLEESKKQALLSGFVFLTPFHSIIS